MAPSLLLLLLLLWPVGCTRPPSISSQHPSKMPPSPIISRNLPQITESIQADLMRSSKNEDYRGCIPTDGRPYAGKASTTESGLMCQMWSVNTPHEHTYHEVGDHNFCRNPDGDVHGLWCYTTDPGTTWESCNVPPCMSFTKGIITEKLSS